MILDGIREVRDVSASARGLYALTLNCWSVAQLSWIWRIFSKKLWTDNWDRSWFSRKVMICSSPIPQILSWKTVKVTVTTLLSTTCFVVLAFNFLCASFFFLTAKIFLDCFGLFSIQSLLLSNIFPGKMFKVLGGVFVLDGNFGQCFCSTKVQKAKSYWTMLVSMYM